MVCNECQELLSDYIDGELELGEQVKIERHLGDCEPCRAVRDDLLQIVHFSHQLPEQTPSGALWSRIQSEIAEQQPASAWSRARSRWARMANQHFNFSIPQMIGAAAALVILVSVSVIVSRRDSGLQQMSLDSGVSSFASEQVRTLSNRDIQDLEK